MKIGEAIKKKNRTLLEMQIGIVFWGLVCQVAGLFLAERQGYYAKSLWFGIAFAIISAIHMYRTIDRALGHEDDAFKLVTRGYVLRNIFVTVVLIAIAVTEVMNPLVTFLGYMGLKVAAYLQPITHKICCKIFHE